MERSTARQPSLAFTAPSPASAILTTLSEQWYNTVVSSLGLDQTKFQLMQGALATGTTSLSIWNFFDAIPPLSLTQQFDPGGYNSLSSIYGAVVNNLVPQTDNGMQTLLGDKYASWAQYRQTPANVPNPLPKTPNGQIDFVGVQVQMYQTWGIMNVDANTISAGTTLLEQKDVVATAIAMYLAANGTYPYTATYAALQAALQQGQARTLSFNSQQASSDTSHSWAGGSVSGFYEFFSGSAGGSWDSFNQQLQSSGITVSATFQSVATIPGQPLATNQPLNPDLSSYAPWWSSAALQVARQHDDNTVWKHGAPTWSDTFGPSGNLTRLSTAMVVVDGIDMTITTNFAVSSDQRTDIQTAARAGFWPFFSAEGQGGFHHEVTASNNQGATIHTACPRGNPTVIGVLVDPISVVLGGS